MIITELDANTNKNMQITPDSYRETVKKQLISTYEN